MALYGTKCKFNFERLIKRKNIGETCAIYSNIETSWNI